MMYTGKSPYYLWEEYKEVERRLKDSARTLERISKECKLPDKTCRLRELDICEGCRSDANKLFGIIRELKESCTLIDEYLSALRKLMDEELRQGCLGK